MQRDTARAGRIALLAGEAGIGKSTLIQPSPTAWAIEPACSWDSAIRWSHRASGPLHDIT